MSCLACKPRRIQEREESFLLLDELYDGMNAVSKQGYAEFTGEVHTLEV